MANQNVSEFHDNDRSRPGHTCLRTFNHSTRAVSLHCEEDGWYSGPYLPDRWRDKHLTDAWNEHLAEPTSADTRPSTSEK